MRQVARHVHIVLFEEDNLPFELLVPRRPEDLLYELLARFVAGVRLAGEDDLHWPTRLIPDFVEPVRVAEQQRGSLVSGEAAGKADRQRLGVEQRLHAGVNMRAPVPGVHALTCEVDKIVLQLPVYLPQLTIGCLAQTFPYRGIVQTL